MSTGSLQSDNNFINIIFQWLDPPCWFLLVLFFGPENRDSMFLLNIDSFLPEYTALKARRQRST